VGASLNPLYEGAWNLEGKEGKQSNLPQLALYFIQRWGIFEKRI